MRASPEAGTHRIAHALCASSSIVRPNRHQTPHYAVMTAPDSTSIPEDTYEGLLEATMIALIKHGYSDLTVRDIDEEWDRSRQLINYYFDGKDDLLTSVLYDVLSYAEGEIDSTTEEPPKERLSDMVRMALLGPQENREGFWQFMTAIYEIQGQAHHHPAYQELLNQVTDDYIADLADVIEAGIEQGEFRDVDAQAVAAAIDDLITGAHTKRIYLGRADACRETFAFIERQIIADMAR